MIERCQGCRQASCSRHNRKRDQDRHVSDLQISPFERLSSHACDPVLIPVYNLSLNSSLTWLAKTTQVLIILILPSVTVLDQDIRSLEDLILWGMPTMVSTRPGQ